MTELGRALDLDDSVPPHGEDAVLVGVQSALTGRPGVLPVARAMSHFGEHSLGWLAIAALGAVLQPQRRRSWLLAGAGTFAAHVAAVIVKRIVRRKRPNHPAIAVNVGTPSALSFPSAHATSTAAAAVLLGRAAGLRRRGRSALMTLLVPPMALSRLVLGVHYPSDVAAGALIGAAVAAAAIRLDNSGDSG
ncbi:phosphatase PAP2 family protein [Mycobacterium sp. SVM_VP21]|nr:phosphatase PAP2 family protein [Mycobacterium sp. SVM_VP21]